MEFSVEFYKNQNGQCPVEEFLENLEISDPDDYDSVISGLAKLKNRAYHREPFCKSLGSSLFELRLLGKLNARMLWFYVKGKRIVVVHGVRNKGQSFHEGDLKIARDRMRDWEMRNEP